MLLLMFVPSLVENGCKTKSVLQIENSGSTTTLSCSNGILIICMHILFASQEVESLYQPNISMRILYASQEVESKYRKAHFVCASQEVESVYQPSSGDTRILYASGEVESEYAYFVCFPGS